MEQQYDKRNGDRRRESDRWHIGREIPIAVLVTLILQTGAGVWFFATLTAKVDRATDTLNEFRVERYTKEDARRDRELMMQMFKISEERDAAQAARIEFIERKIGR